jgi:phosphatidate phosphatase PAH1|tara:strand:- start:25 stop:516 length:492 start_codon:yes stop_codon:yes gene_type:complete
LYGFFVVAYGMSKNIIIFDLDGTLAIIDKRRDLSRKPNGKIDFNKLHDSSLIKHDVPNMPVVKMAQLFAENGFTIVIFSGRSDKTMLTTRSWLTHNRVPFHTLIMRPHKTMNFVPDEVLKKQMLDNAPFDVDDILMVVDDRQKVVDMWRSLGLTVFQVADGNF